MVLTNMAVFFCVNSVHFGKWVEHPTSASHAIPARKESPLVHRETRIFCQASMWRFDLPSGNDTNGKLIQFRRQTEHSEKKPRTCVRVPRLKRQDWSNSSCSPRVICNNSLGYVLVSHPAQNWRGHSRTSRMWSDLNLTHLNLRSIQDGC